MRFRALGSRDGASKPAENLVLNMILLNPIREHDKKNKGLPLGLRAWSLGYLRGFRA